MEAEEILAQAKAPGELPASWKVFPLVRRTVTLALFGWAFGFILGTGLLVLAVPDVIPVNYQHGPVSAFFTTLLLGILLFVALGSLYAFIIDARRLRDAANHLLVITPSDFVKQEGKKIIHVPLVNVRYVTTRGVQMPKKDDATSIKDVPGASENTVAFFLGRGLVPSGQRWLKRRRRTSITLAFIDTRTEQQVIALTDTAYGDPFLIAAFLKDYAAHAIV